jgi:hypothetical protein
MPHAAVDINSTLISLTMHCRQAVPEASLNLTLIVELCLRLIFVAVVWPWKLGGQGRNN